jgi:hypothetical protein
MIVRAATAAGLLALSIVVGIVAARVSRKWLKGSRSTALQDAAEIIASGLFWLFLSVGIVLALAMTDPTQLAPIPSRLLAYFPRAIVAMLMIVGARVAGSLVGHTVVQAAHRATGKINTSLGTAVRVAILAGGAILAVSQLGIDTTILTILVAALAFGSMLGAALVVGLGGRRVASQVAAGRAMRELIGPGARVSSGALKGTVVEMHRVGVEIERSDGTRVHLPYERLLDDVVEFVRAPQ